MSSPTHPIFESKPFNSSTRVAAFAVAAALLVGPVWASNPGEPLDCSDWVFLEPGYWCEQFVPFPCTAGIPFCDNVAWQGFPPDNEFFFYKLRAVLGVAPACHVGGIPLNEVQLVRVISRDEEVVIGYLRERCNGDARDRSEPCLGTGVEYPACLFFDPPTGRMLVKTWNQRSDIAQAAKQIFAIRGFTSLLELQQTYEPTASTFGFRVPYMPEGFQYADWFDTYYGELANPIDFSQAQPLQCGYPASAPQVGDYLTVADTVPDPQPGQGYYFITAANYMGQRRYGRKATNGVLTGRDPAVLPGCN